MWQLFGSVKTFNPNQFRKVVLLQFQPGWTAKQYTFQNSFPVSRQKLSSRFWFHKYTLQIGWYQCRIFSFIYKAQLCPDIQHGVWQNTGRRLVIQAFVTTLYFSYGFDRLLIKYFAKILFSFSNLHPARAVELRIPVLRQALNVGSKAN